MVEAGIKRLTDEGASYELACDSARLVHDLRANYDHNLADIADFAVRPLISKSGLRKGAALLCVSALALSGLPVTGADLPPKADELAPHSDIDIRVGRNNNSGRLEIYGGIGSRASVRKQDNQIIIHLPSDHKPDIGDLRVNLPLGVKSVELGFDGRAYELKLTLEPKSSAQFGRQDGAVFVEINPSLDNSHKNMELTGPDAQKIADQIRARDAKSQPQQAEKQAAPVIPDQNLQQVVVEVNDSEGGRDLKFDFPEIVGAAIFRRGQSVWIVFDREVLFKIPPYLKDGNLVEDVSYVHKDGFTALKLKAPSLGTLSAKTEQQAWYVRLGGVPLKDRSSGVVNIVREDESGSATLKANLNGAQKIAYIIDPEVGDRMAIIPAKGPIKSVLKPRLTPEAHFAPTTQGVVLDGVNPNISVVLDGDFVEVSKPGGLSLSTLSSLEAASQAEKMQYGPAALPSLMNETWETLPASGFLATYNRLQADAADEAQAGMDGATKARITLGRFLIGQGMYYEAQGLMDLLMKQTPRAQSDPFVRGLRLISKMAVGRYNDAQSDLDSPALARDPAAQLWRGLALEKKGNHEEARKAFAAGASALDKFPPLWRTRMATANASAALAAKDMKSALNLISYAVHQEVPPLERLDALLVAGRIIEAQGDHLRALGVYEEIAKCSLGRISTPAAVRATKLKLDLGRIKPQQALADLDNLRFRWRGDDTELEIINTMSDIYLNAGRYRDALAILKAAGQKFINNPAEEGLNKRLSEAFRSLFLGGLADGLQPIEALGLFYDFQDLTPVGTDGDDMVRKLVRRLVDVDLLTQAAQLLQHQVDNRLEGTAKSAVAGDLAAIYLMNREPEKALQALWKTKSTILPKDVLQQRKMIEARALLQLGQLDDAVEVLGPDTSPEGMDIRADIFWQQKDWPKAAMLLEKHLADRYKSDGHLSSEDEARLIKAGVAYSLASDQGSLVRLSQRYSKFIEGSAAPDALRIALAGMDNGPMNAKDFALTAAQADSFAGWVEGMKKKLRERADAIANAPKKIA